MSKFYATGTVFKKVSNFDNGPCKPTTTTSSDTAANAKAVVTALADKITGLAPGEAINITVQCTEK